MKHFTGVLAFLTLALAAWTPGLAHAQGLSGQIGGSVVDGSKGAVPGATVTVRNTATAVTRDVVTDSEGLFVFTNLFAGTYDLRVTLTGFRTYEQKGLALSATERLAVPPITLEVGGLEEVVTVEASAVHAQAQSGERSGTIRADEIKDTQLRGRDFLGLLQGMPGVVDTNVRNAPGWNAFLGTQINGLSDQLMGMSYDGVSSKDTGFGAANYVTPSLDSIAEVKIQTSNYQAEYGRAGGANIIVVTKSGSSRFSGSAAYFKRHEALTTNSWDRRRACDASGGTSALCAKARYRYDNSAFTLGGPVLIPGTTFNEKRDKLFFFYSLDLLPRTDPFLVSSTMPSALERNGDFSQTRNNAGALRFIRNPFSGLACNVNTGGPGCFPGNVIPQNLIHPMGRQILNLFPLPDPALVGNPVTQGNYNYQFAGDTEKLRRDNVVRVDWNVRPGTMFYTRLQMGKEVFGRGQFNETAPALIAGAGMGFPWSEGSYDINTAGYVANLTHTFSGSTVLEIIGGSNWAEQDVYPLTQADWNALDYRNHLPGHRQYFSENNPNHILPDITFMPAAGGANALPNTRNINIGQGQAFPWLASNPAHNFSVNLTHLRGKHNLKAGFFYERSSRPGAMSSNAGTYNFNSDTANPLDTNLGWANAMLGHLNIYTENNNNTRSMPQFNQPEFFVQDNWRLNRTFTLDLGVRFSHIGVVREPGRDIGWFDPNAWDPGKAVQLWQPHCANGVFPCTGANRVARNPLTGEQRPSPWIGAVVAGSGDINNGTVFGQGLPDTFPSAGHQDRAASRVRLGRLRRRQDRGARRLWHQLQPAGRWSVRWLHRGHEPDGELAVDHDRRSVQCAIAREPARWHRRSGRDAAHYGALLEHWRAARAAVAPPSRRRLCGQYHAQCVRGQCRPVLHEPAERSGSAPGRQSHPVDDRSHDRQRAADQPHSSQLPGTRRGHAARLPRRAVPQLQRDPDGSPPPAGQWVCLGRQLHLVSHGAVRRV